MMKRRGYKKNITNNSVINIMKISTIFNKLLKEDSEIDNILDKINSVGVDGLSELEKLRLASANNDTNLMKTIDLSKLYQENGKKFGLKKIKVMVKPVANQSVNDEESKKYAGQVGYLLPYTFNNDDLIPMIPVRFGVDLEPNTYTTKGTERIPVSNLIPIGYKP